MSGRVYTISENLVISVLLISFTFQVGRPYCTLILHVVSGVDDDLSAAG